MRKLSFVVVAVMLLVTENSVANDVKKVNPDNSLSAQISALLSDNNFNEDQKDVTAQVRFTLNTEGEIVVLSVVTENDKMERFVKSKLNYQKVNLNEVKEGKIYTIPVRVKA